MIHIEKAAPKILKNLDPSQPIKYHEKAIDDWTQKAKVDVDLKPKEEKKKLKRKGSLDTLLSVSND